MTLARKTQIVLVAAAVCLFVLLFLAPKTHTPQNNDKLALKSGSEQTASVESFFKPVLKTLSVDEKKTYDMLFAQASLSKTDSAYKPLVVFWDSKKRPDFAAYFVEKTAVANPSSDRFYKAGDRYYYSVRFIKENTELPTLYQSAMRCYQKALDLNPKNTEAKIQLAACYVDGTQDPMKGITLLREVEKTDSNNVKLQLSFAFFSAKSQQWDKAIKRFEKVLKIDPLYIEAYLHLADAYEQQGDKGKTILMLEKYAEVTDDVMAKQEVLKYITQLKQK
jgi:tetratricopeptide (TPR) repeat protein